MKSEVLDSQIEPNSEGKLLNLGNSVEKFEEKLELRSASVVGVDELVQSDQHPDEKSVLEGREKHRTQDMAMESVPLEENSGSYIAETAEKSMVEVSEQEVLFVSGVFYLQHVQVAILCFL